MKKTFLKVLALSAVLVTAVSCGESKTQDTGKIKITFWHTMGQANQKTLNNMIEAFNKIPGNENIVVEHVAQGDYSGIYEKIQKAIPAKTTPTMAYCYPDHVADYLDANSVVDLTDLMNDPEIGYTSTNLSKTDANYKIEDDANDFISTFLKEGQEYAQKGTYSLPFSKSTEVMFYNETYLKKNGFVDASGNAIVPTKWENEDDPTDYTAIINLCRAIKKKDPTIQAPLGYDSDDNLFITFCKQLDIPYTSIGEDGRGSLDFNNDKAKAMVTKIKGWYDEGLIKTKGTIESNSYTSTMFKKQSLIFSIGSTGGTSYNEPAKDSDEEYEFSAQVAAMPQFGTTKYCISQGPSICFFKNKKIKDEQTRAAFKFYKFITNPENSAAYSILTGYEPVKSSSYTTDAYKNHLNKTPADLFTKVANLTQNLQDAYFVSPAFIGSATSRVQVGGIITQVCLGNKTVDTAFKDAFDNSVFALPIE